MIKRKITPYIENISEATCACLITMVQGNILSLTLAHWLIASQTGLIAGTIASTTIIAAKLRRQWLISLTLGITTAVIDFFVHPNNFGMNVYTEAIVTGVGAAFLSYAISLCLRTIRLKYLHARNPNNETESKIIEK